MPANLPPHYHDLEARARAATDPAEKLALYRELWVLLPKHKHTEKMQADLKSKMSRLRKEPGSRGGSGGRGKLEFQVERSGAGQVFVIGPPNAGKSALLRALTSATPEVSEAPFTTKKPVPGMMKFEDVGIQLVEAPAVFPGLTPKWLGPHLRICDALVLCFGLGQDDLLERWDDVRAELERAKIVAYNPDAEAPEPEDPGLEPLPAFVFLTQADLDAGGEMRALFEEYSRTDLPILTLSTVSGQGLAEVPGRLYRTLGLMRIYSKLPGKPPDMESPFVVPAGTDVVGLTAHIHKELVERFQFARLWRGERYEGGRVSGDFVLEDKDVVEVHA
jgi:ribosome-interacting GTPase 1